VKQRLHDVTDTERKAAHQFMRSLIWTEEKRLKQKTNQEDKGRIEEERLE
jgi:hypothetical protein